MTDLSTWTPPPEAAPYIPTISSVEGQYGMPHNLLARLLYQESRYREDIINGSTTSSAGALGIAQIVPRWHPGVNPIDPFEAIPYAGKYLYQLYRQFGTWEKALAAYNWGPGNLGKTIDTYGILWRNELPTETHNYIVQITGDIPGAKEQTTVV